MCRRQATNETVKEGLKSYAIVTIYTRLELTMCRHKLTCHLTNIQQHLILHSLLGG